MITVLNEEKCIMHYSKDSTFFDWFLFAFYIFKSELKKECINYKKKKCLKCTLTMQCNNSALQGDIFLFIYQSALLSIFFQSLPFPVESLHCSVHILRE